MAHSSRESISREELIGTIWPDDEPESARTKLRMALSSLRRQLEPPDIGPGVVVTANRLNAGLNHDVVRTDTGVFEMECAAADREPILEAQLARLESAVSHCAGDLLPGYYEDWVVVERERIRCLMIRSLTRIVRGMEQSGQIEAAIPYAERITREEPLDEDGSFALIRLLHLSGQQNAALGQYRRLQHILETEVGGTPSKSLGEIVAAIPSSGQSITGSAGLSGAAAYDTAGSAKPGRVALRKRESQSVSRASDSMSEATSTLPNSLPARVTRFFGREDELQFLESELLAMFSSTEDGARVLTLIGAGGAGKTRLAIELGARLAQLHTVEISFIPLANLKAAAEAPELIATLLSLPASQTDATTRLQEAMASRPILLILDNLEQLGDDGDTTRQPPIGIGIQLDGGPVA